MSRHRDAYRKSLKSKPEGQLREELLEKTNKSTCVGLDGEVYRDLDAIQDVIDIKKQLAVDKDPVELCVHTIARHIQGELIIRASQAAQPSVSDDQGTTDTAIAGERTVTGSNVTVT
jgi:hypothetical protein